MATYKIVNRRKKSVGAAPAPELPFVADVEKSVPASAPLSSGEAAFRFYEEFFTSEKPTSAAEEQAPSLSEVLSELPTQTAESEPVDLQSKVAELDRKSDLIDPESVEPTREFDLEEVRRAFASKTYSAPEEQTPPENAAEPTPAAPEQTAAESNREMSAFFTALFGEEEKKSPSREKKNADATTAIPEIPVAPVAPTVQVETESPTSAVSGDTIRIPSQASQAFSVPPVTPVGGVELTRANITDLVGELPPSDAKSEEEDEEEFTRPEEADALEVSLKKKKSALWRRFAALCVLFFAALYLESATFPFLNLPLPEFLTPGKFGIVYLLFDLQLLVFTAALAFGQIKSGVTSLFSGKANANSAVFLALLVNVVQLGVLIFAFATAETYVLFGAVSVFLSLCGVLRAIFSLASDLRALRLLSQNKEKLAAGKTGENSPEAAAFSEYLEELEPEVFSVNRTDFVDGFIRRTENTAAPKGAYALALALALLFSVGIAVWCFIGSGNRNTLHALNAFVCSMMMSIPAAGIFSHTLPFFFASRRAAKTGTAILGESAVEESCAVEILSFDDTEVFLPKHVKVTSVRTYGAARIDRVLIYCAQIFRVVGGPLSYVFENSISSLSVPGVVEIVENRGEGVRARIDGKEVCLGGSAFMEACEIPVELDESDTTFENTVGRIMYLSEGGELAAKFYIKYAVSARFCAQLSALESAGIYVAVKTCDPNIDAVLLQKILHKDNYPIAVIKTGNAAKNAPCLSRVDAPIAGVGKVSGVINGFLLCDAVRSRASLGTLTKFVSILIGLFISFVLLGMQNAYLTPAVCLLYQLLWLLPVVVPSLFDWPMPPRKIKKKRS